MSTHANRIRRKLNGESVSPGTAAAEALLFTPFVIDTLEINSYPVADIPSELERLNSAIQKSRSQLREIYLQLHSGKSNADVQYIFKIQLQLLEDASLLTELKEELLSRRLNIEHIIARYMRILQTRFASIDDELLRSKFFDIQDVCHRILRNMLNVDHIKNYHTQQIEKEVIFVAEKLLPSDLALLDLKKIMGIVIEEESCFSHVAVMLKSLSIPAVINTPGATSLTRSGDSLLLDAYNGTIVIWPDDKEINAAVKKNKSFLSNNADITRRHAKLCVTTDGRRIHLEANIGSLKEAREALQFGAEGVGLLRSELYYLSLGRQPSIKEECEFYLGIADTLKRKPLTIRLLDLGADKNPPFLEFHNEDNPQLGIRGARYLLSNPELLHRHLCAIMSVCKSHHVKILLPFISIPEDLYNVLDFIYSVCKEQNVNKNRLHIGIMVEIPSAALYMRSFLPKISFASIGTNDLAQYLFAANREDAGLKKYRQAAHPIMLRLIKKISHDAQRYKKKISVCGEAASNPFTAALLIGCGITTLSMHPSSIPAVRETINHLSFADTRRMLRKALLCDDYAMVEKACGLKAL